GATGPGPALRDCGRAPVRGGHPARHRARRRRPPAAPGAPGRALDDARAVARHAALPRRGRRPGARRGRPRPGGAARGRGPHRAPGRPAGPGRRHAAGRRARRAGGRGRGGDGRDRRAGGGQAVPRPPDPGPGPAGRLGPRPARRGARPDLRRARGGPRAQPPGGGPGPLRGAARPRARPGALGGCLNEQAFETTVVSSSPDAGPRSGATPKVSHPVPRVGVPAGSPAGRDRSGPPDVRATCHGPPTAERTTPVDRQKNLEMALSQIEKQFGKGSVMRMGEKGAMAIEAISTGALSLDLALGIGGLPRGRITEIYGPESSGKPTLALHVVAEAQRNGGICAYIDAEHALDPVYAQAIGVDIDELLISQPDTGEQALEIADMLVRSGAIDVVVVDSVAALTPRAEIEGEMGDSHV